MKVIAKSNNGYILEASADDVAAIQGLYTHKTRIEIGTVLDIYGLFNKYRIISNALDDVSKLEQSAELMMKAVDWVKQFRCDKE